MILDEQVKPRWLVICSCGWERETCREFSQYFRVVDYIEQGATSSHDLVVMRKK
jgi:hypothetical protein